MGFEKEVLRAGTGPKPVPGQNVTVHCTGFGKNGDLSQKFWRVQQVSGENIEYHGGTTHVKSPANQRVIAMMLNISPVISTSVLFWFENLGSYPSFKCNFLCPKIFAFPYFVSIFGRHVSTKDAGQKPFTFKIGQGQVIKGWDEGVLGMQLGEVARLRCTPDYAYGAGGFPAWGIQPNSVLVFEIEVLSAQ